MTTQTVQPVVSRGSVERGAPWVRPSRLLIVIVAYRAVELTIDCLASLEPEIKANPGVGVIVCENGTGGDAAARIERAIAERGWAGWVDLWEATPNRGFAGGNNVVLEDVLTWADPPEHVLLLNADTVVRVGAINLLLRAADKNPGAGVVSPRLEWPDGTPQVSCFRHFEPLTELDKSAGIGLITRLLRRFVTAIPVCDEPTTPDWTSFACALIRFEVLKAVGVLDPGFFLYYDDPDYCRRVWKAGWRVMNIPEARVVHLRGKSNPAKELQRNRKRRPWYHFASRARFYAKHHGHFGLLLANLCWTAGHCFAFARRLVFGTPVPACDRELRDIWTNFWNPMKMPERGQDG